MNRPVFELTPSKLLKYPVRKRKAMLGEFDFFEFLFAF